MSGLFDSLMGASGENLQIWFTPARKMMFAGTGTALAIAYIQYQVHTKTQLECENIKNRIIITNGEPIPDGCTVLPFEIELPDNVYKNMGMRS